MNDPVEAIASRLKKAAESVELLGNVRTHGVVTRIGDGVAYVTGLGDVGYEELVRCDSGALGMAYDLAEDETGVVLLTRADEVCAGEGVRGTGQLPSLPVGESVLGRTFDPLGNPLDEGPPLPRRDMMPLFRPAPEIVERKPVDETLWTGVLAIDAAIPIGRGQRELIIGDRNVGKTALAVDIIAAQTRGDVACVYVVIGQPMSRVLSLRKTLQDAGVLSNSVIVVADASSSPGLQYLAPYAGASVAEFFRDQQRHALVVYDDLTKHADAYRELALLMGRPPGREAFPGDIFYIHAELLERATARNAEHGGGSVTALPVIETTDGDISSYIPTNLISITDGQIYLDTGRYDRNHRPAIDVGRSVSRVGGIAQTGLMRKAAKQLKITLSRFESLESLTRVGLEMDVGMRELMKRGSVLRELLRQARLERRKPIEQVIGLLAAGEGWLDDLPLKTVRPCVRELAQKMQDEHPTEVDELLRSDTISDAFKELLKQQIQPLRQRYQES